MTYCLKVGDGILATTAYYGNGNIKRLQHWGGDYSLKRMLFDNFDFFNNTCSNSFGSFID